MNVWGSVHVVILAGTLNEEKGRAAGAVGKGVDAGSVIETWAGAGMGSLVE